MDWMYYIHREMPCETCVVSCQSNHAETVRYPMQIYHAYIALEWIQIHPPKLPAGYIPHGRPDLIGLYRPNISNFRVIFRQKKS